MLEGIGEFRVRGTSANTVQQLRGNSRTDCLSGQPLVLFRTYLELVLEASGGGVRVNLVEVVEGHPQLLGLNRRLSTCDQLIQSIVDEHVLSLAVEYSRTDSFQTTPPF